MVSSLQELLKNDAQAISILLTGGVGVMPTDTIYGLVARAADKNAVARLYELKKREHKPGTIIAASMEQLVELGVPRHHLRAVEHLWPNPISIETPLGDNLKYLHQGTGRQGFRIASDKRMQTILAQTGPLLTSSANQPGEPNSNNIREAFTHFGGSVDFYVDKGDLSGRPPSTIIGISTDNKITIYREGAVRVDPDTGTIVS
jgi:L-threonylcarbamoyladenylate synthase